MSMTVRQSCTDRTHVPIRKVTCGGLSDIENVFSFYRMCSHVLHVPIRKVTQSCTDRTQLHLPIRKVTYTFRADAWAHPLQRCKPLKNVGDEARRRRKVYSYLTPWGGGGGRRNEEKGKGGRFIQRRRRRRRRRKVWRRKG